MPKPATYSASFSAVTPFATAADWVALLGDGTMAIRLRRLTISGIATAQDSTPVLLSKRSTLNTGGTPASITAVPHDSTQRASIATVNKYTAAPSGSGTLVGILWQTRLSLAKAAASSGVGPIAVCYDFDGDNLRAPSLLTATEMLIVGLGGGAVPSGAALDLSLTWTEEPLP